MLALIYVMITTRSIPEPTEELVWVLAALYGANQLGHLGQAFAEAHGEAHARTGEAHDHSS